MKFRILLILFISALNLNSNSANLNTQKNNYTDSHRKEIKFSSSDKNLEKTFYWAKEMALSYAHDGTDPVGYWIEAALPERYAFCMRDMAHQSIGAEIMGLSRHNENMMTKFVENISEGKDWCSFWEINRENKPAPVDYTDDDHFWYNLNANFDILQACLKLYEWTGNQTYLKDPRFLNFYRKSLNEYVKSWQLEPDRLMNRPKYLNVKDPQGNTHSFTRGLPSYVENYPDLTASSDLIATIYAGFMAYSEIAKINKEKAESVKYRKIAQQYQDLLENKWWNDRFNSYHTFWTSNNEFANGEGLTFILWFDAINKPERIRATIQKIMNVPDWNVENQSYFPALYYRFNYLPEAYRQLISLSTVNRCEYPEVSYGALEGVIGGTMGIKPVFSEKRVITLPKFTKERENDWAEVENLPVFGGYISVRHDNNKTSCLTNNTGQAVTWRASFHGEYSKIKVNEKILTGSVSPDKLGNKISYVDIKIPKGGKMTVSVSE